MRFFYHYYIIRLFIGLSRRVSIRRGQTVAVPSNSISNSYSDNVGRYLSQPVRNENSYPSYVPMVRRLEENKNSDSKVKYVLVREMNFAKQDSVLLN